MFEAGIKLGGIFHQYLGIPVASRTAASLARTIEAAVALQPFVTGVQIRIVPRRAGPSGRGRFGYHYLTAEMIDARVELTDGRAHVVARLVYRADLRYPLMRVESVRERSGRRATSRAGRSARR